MAVVVTSVLAQPAHAAPAKANPVHLQALTNTLEKKAQAPRVQKGADGFVQFIGAPPNDAFSVAAPVSKAPADVARRFLADHEEAFTTRSPHLNYVHRRTSAARDNHFVHLGQTYKGIDVFGAGIVVQTNPQGNVACVVSDILKDTTQFDSGAISVTPTVTSAAAQQLALEWMADQYDFPTADFDIVSTQLVVFDPSLLTAPGTLALAWSMEVRHLNDRAAEQILVDAHTASVIFHYTLIHDALNRQIFNADNVQGSEGVLARGEGQMPSSVSEVNKAYDYLGNAYNFYVDHHSRLSIDNLDMPVIATVRYCDAGFGCPMDNAFWNDRKIYFGQGWAVDDIVAHEYTHGVTQHSSGLIYYRQPGAINESFSDIWGEFVDLTNGKGSDGNAVRWLIGEDLLGGRIRSMIDPPAEGDPDKVSKAYTGFDDYGGVHTNSGIVNKMCYLLTDGGAFNGKTINAMGIDTVADLFYEAQVNLLNPCSGFRSLYSIMQQAAVNLGLSPTQISNVMAAGQAVELDKADPVVEVIPQWVDQVDLDDDGYFTEMGLLLDCNMPGGTVPVTFIASVYVLNPTDGYYHFYTMSPQFTVTGATPNDAITVPIVAHPHGMYDYLVIISQVDAEQPDIFFYGQSGNDLYHHPEEVYDGDAISLEEALDTRHVNWAETDDPWLGVKTLHAHDGEDAARSAAVGDLETSLLSTSVVGPTKLSFWWKVSSEEDYDILYFLIDGEVYDLISGVQNWAQVADVYLPPGTHDLQWAYTKDESFYREEDCGWVDEVVIEGLPCSLTLHSNPEGAGTITPDLAPDVNGEYPYGTVLSLLATAADGYTFGSWSGHASGTDNPVEITLDGGKTVTANFLPNRSLTFDPNPDDGGTITADPLPGPDGKYAHGTVVTVTATANFGFSFGSWGSDATGTTVTTEIIMDGDKTVTANFIPNRILTFNPNPADGGTITLDPLPGPDGKYANNTEVTLTAHPSTGFTFGLWSGAASGYNPTVKITMDSNKSVTAIFWRNRMLTLKADPPNGGTITASPAPREDGRYAYNTLVTLTAHPAPAYSFGSWSGTNGTLTAMTAQVYMSSDKTVTAKFIPRYKLTTAASPEAGGSILLSPPPDDEGLYLENTEVTLSIRCNNNYAFNSWMGDAAGTTWSTKVKMTSSKSVVAEFLPKYSLNITAAPSNAGTISVSPPPGSDGKYVRGTEVTITPTPHAGNQFSSWGGDVSSTASSLTLTVNEDMDITANFLARYFLSTTCSPLSTGTITASPPPGDDGRYATGTWVTLTAEPRTGYTFGGWSGGGLSGSTTPIQILVDDEKSVTASFIRKYTLTLTSNAGGSIEATPPPDEDGYLSGTVVTLTPVANPGFSFANWSEGVSGTTAPTQITMTANKTVSASFLPRYSISLTTSPANGGQVLTDPAPDGDGKYLAGTKVTLTAIPDTGFSFDSWSGHATSTASAIQVTLNGNKNILANFSDRHTLSVSATPQGAGQILISPDPGPDGRYAAGTVVTLTPQPAAGYAFNSWLGNLSGASNPVEVTMTASKNITANFAPEPLHGAISSVGWTNQVDNDGDGYYSSMTLTWNADVVGGTGSVNVYAKVYQRPAGATDWTYLGYTTNHVITGASAGDIFGMALNPQPNGQYDYRIELYQPNQLQMDSAVGPNVIEALAAHPEELPDEDLAPDAPSPVSCPGTATKSVKETVLPLDLDAAPNATVATGSSLSIRLTNETGIDPETVWADAEVDGTPCSGTVTWTATNEDDNSDGWVIFTPDNDVSGTLVLTVGAATFDGIELQPVSHTYIVSDVESSPDAPVLETADVPAAGSTPAYRLLPQGAYPQPQIVQVPVPQGADPENIEIYYYSDSNDSAGWYKGQNVEGWLVPQTRRTIVQDGNTYIQFEVRHSGTIQLRLTEKFSAAALKPSLPDLSLLALVLLVLALRRKGARTN